MYNLLILDKDNNKETLLKGFGSESKVLDFCSKHCEDFKGFDIYASACDSKLKQNKGVALNVDLFLHDASLNPF